MDETTDNRFRDGRDDDHSRAIRFLTLLGLAMVLGTCSIMTANSPDRTEERRAEIRANLTSARLECIEEGRLMGPEHRDQCEARAAIKYAAQLEATVH